jgi:hypothetical protein
VVQVARTLGRQRIAEPAARDIDQCFRNFLAAIFKQAIYDLKNPTYCMDAEAWLGSPRAKEVALLLDIELPSVETIRQRINELKDEDDDEADEIY